MENKDIFRKKDFLTELVQSDSQSSETEFPICQVAFDGEGGKSLINVLNYEKAYYGSLETLNDDIDEMANDFKMGVYLLQIKTEGHRDYWGEYDSWTDLEQMKEYKLEDFE